MEKRLKLEGEIRVRLKSICSKLGDEEFDKLVEKIADNSIRSDARSAFDFLPTGFKRPRG